MSHNDYNESNDNDNHPLVLESHEATHVKPRVSLAERSSPRIDSSSVTLPQAPAPLPNQLLSPTTIHALLILSDSALPLGSFAFSSGLESYLAHHHQDGHHQRAAAAPGGGGPAVLDEFLQLSVSSLASTSLPYVRAAYHSPRQLLALDETYDASLTCTVTRRASVAQGKALLALWHRAFRLHRTASSDNDDDQRECTAAVDALEHLRRGRGGGSSSNSDNDNANNNIAPCHFPPLWGVITRLLGLPAQQSAYVFVFNHVKAVVSAAVRANVLGPYQAQAVLAAPALQTRVADVVRTYWHVSVDDAGQCAPVVDLWVGRHEVLYSRIFNS